MTDEDYKAEDRRDQVEMRDEAYREQDRIGAIALNEKRNRDGEQASEDAEPTD